MGSAGGFCPPATFTRQPVAGLPERTPIAVEPSSNRKEGDHHMPAKKKAPAKKAKKTAKKK